MTLPANTAPLSAHPDARPPDSARGAIIAGGVILAIFFGGFGTWAALAPLNSAVIGPAIVKVEGNRKSVQHLDGGIVREVRVKDGDRVNVGDVLIVLDSTQLRAERDVLSTGYAMLRATEARLRAERDGRETITQTPDPFVDQNDAATKAAIAGQVQEFLSRQSALRGQESVVQQRIAQAQEQIAGYESQATAYRTQLASVQAERESLNELLAKGLVTKPRVLQLDRTATGLEAQIGTAEASIGNARQTINEYAQQIEQFRKVRAEEIARDLHDVEAKLADILPRLQNAIVALERAEIRSPYAGRVVGLAVFSTGAVVARGERVLDVVPDETALVVEAQVHVEDIADVHPGMQAEVHFTSYKQRVTPILHGKVATISADRLTDERSGVPYYLTRIDVNPDELAASPEIKLYPGMPATVMITTEARSALDYIFGPLTASIDGAFRQK